ncbi:MAG: hypothetical protein OSA81_11985 [Longimicrobiales bacterium]|nr:hypothetical protein [Longimicrobiales bacterium]
MSVSIVFLVVTAVAGIGIGIWLGMPGRYSQTVDELEQSMATGGKRRALKKRNVNPLAWMHRNASAKNTPSRERRVARGRRSRFSLESPENPDS